MSITITCTGCRATINVAAGDSSQQQQPCAKCGTKKWSVEVTPDTLQVNLSPFAFQHYAKDFYEAFKKVKGGAKFSPARLTLLAQAVELAAKSLHVDQGKRDDDLHKIRHDLVVACDPVTLGMYGITIAGDEATELKKLSDLNKSKAFEYFWFLRPSTKKDKKNPDQTRAEGLMHALTGRKDLPDERVIEGLLIKLLVPEM